MVKKISSIVIVILLIIIFVLTFYKVNKRHEERLYDVLYSEIKYQANKCFLEKKCESIITLEELYNKEYLEIQYDPISKIELDKNIKIKIMDKKIEIVE